ncbi:eIF4E-3b [Symbiodinium pilosum]|uniref:eIF4E-3b protein n=1 Tax=Symbiodinium pilosum TaxID=2952 RepID=A0A812VX19_SYMPI|nr:eIF4E-3b [Symbiodinium pilosum]
MEGRMQRHCLHFVPKCNPREPLRHERINITFRWVRAHRSRCPLRRRSASKLHRAMQDSKDCKSGPLPPISRLVVDGGSDRAS